MLSSLDYDILCATETWFDCSHTKGIVSNENYNFYRRDREDGYGGVGLWVKRGLKPSIVNLDKQYSNLEILAADFPGNTPFRLVTVYRPPNCNKETSNLIWSCMEKLTNVKIPVTVVGDFNLSDIRWSPHLVYAESELNLTFLQKITQMGLEQYVNEPTRFHPPTGVSNFLDLLFCTDDAFVYDVKVVDSELGSDHYAVEFSSCGPQSEQTKSTDRSFRDFDSADWVEINSFLQSINWNQDVFHSCASAQDFWNELVKVIQFAIDSFIPLKKVRTNNKIKYPKRLKSLIKKKGRLYKQRDNQEKRNEYNRLNEQIRTLTNEIAKTRENKILESKDPNALYKYIRKKRCNDNGVGPLKQDDGSVETDEIKKASLLNTCFAKNFTRDNGTIPSIGQKVPDGVFLDKSINFTPQKVREVILKLKNKKSRTPDGIPANFYKLTANQIAYPLSIVFTASFESGTLPSIWKVADVVPLYKKGESSDPNNYRPVSLTSVACKLMEMCIADEIHTYLRVFKLLAPQQHGFLSRRSTCTQLLECFEDWTSNFEAKDPTDVIYVDFRRAFDSVSHEKLLTKLKAYGIRGKLVEWIKDFLSGRSQRVCLGDSASGYLPVTSGVIQGSVLGPLAFLIFVNDLPDQFDDVTCKLFADDLKLYEKSINFENLWKALKKLEEWAFKWQLGIAVPKCGVLHIASNNPEIDFSLLDAKLPAESCVRDLGVHVSNDLKVSNHCLEISKKANKITNMMFNCLITDDIKVLLHAYKVYIRPLVEYCTPVWSPYQAKDIITIEKVQKYFTRRIYRRCGLNKLEYQDRLKFLGLSSLEKRRLHLDLCMTYKILHNECDLVASDFFVRAPTTHTETRGHRMKLRPITSQGNTRINFFSQRVVNFWNALPVFAPKTTAPVVNAMNLKCFKKRIKTIEFSKFLTFP